MRVTFGPLAALIAIAHPGAVVEVIAIFPMWCLAIIRVWDEFDRTRSQIRSRHRAHTRRSL
jgi:hypothetical protein